MVGNRHDDEVVLLSLEEDGPVVGPVLQRLAVPQPSCVLVG